MKLGGKLNPTLEVDYTPMIDMTFQLIAFFMVLINFEASDQDERIMLPTSELAKPPEGPVETVITIHLAKSGLAIIGGQEFADASQIKPLLNVERTVLEQKGKTTGDATVIIRAHANAKTGDVQRLIEICQESQFEKFVLRAKSD